LLGFAKKNINQELAIEESWYEKLHDWDAARKAYEHKLESNPGEKTLTLGRMRCLQALGEWAKLHSIASKEWDMAPLDMRENMATMAAAAAWGLGKWEDVQTYTQLIPRDSQEGCFFRAVLAIHHNDHLTAQPLIASARDLLEVELAAMVGESYERAYGAMINAQMLSELEEVITFKLVPKKRDSIKTMWWNRLKVSFFVLFFPIFSFSLITLTLIVGVD
jgi:FKBP12-rapamycin complex-associated protein